MATLESFETDLIPTSAGDLSITFLGHSSLLMVFNGKNIFVDPFGQVADYAMLPHADVIISTHEHYDHLDPQAVEAIRFATQRRPAPSSGRPMRAWQPSSPSSWCSGSSRSSDWAPAWCSTSSPRRAR